MDSATVYWIHTVDMTDPRSQGYIGITAKGVEERYKGHLRRVSNGSTLHVHRAIRKYKDKIRISVLYEDTLEFCQLLEWAYRPEPCIGWNIGVGGVSPRLGSKASEETRRKQSERLRGRKLPASWCSAISRAKLGKPQSESSKINRAAANKRRIWTDEARLKAGESKRGKPLSEEHKQKMSVSLKGKAKGISKPNKTKDAPWTHYFADADVWVQAVDLHTYYKEHGVGQFKVANKANTTLGKVASMFRRFKSGWNPSEDPAYLAWLEEHKQKECHESTFAT